MTAGAAYVIITCKCLPDWLFDMIRYIEGLFLTEKTRMDLWKIKHRLRVGTGMTGLYFIMLSDNSNDVFDIVPAPMFKQRRFRHEDHTIIGIAESMRKAYDIVGQIVTEHYNRTGSYTDLKAEFIRFYGID